MAIWGLVFPCNSRHSFGDSGHEVGGVTAWNINHCTNHGALRHIIFTEDFFLFGNFSLVCFFPLQHGGVSEWVLLGYLKYFGHVSAVSKPSGNNEKGACVEL